MKRHLAGAAAAVIVLASGALASACNVAAPAATANGTTISTSSLNSQLAALSGTVSGGCLLQLQDAEITPSDAQGTGGSGTYTMQFVNAVLDDQVGELLAQQYAASKGITVSPSDLSSAKSDLESTLDGEINQAAQESESEGTVSLCQDASGAAISGAALLSGLPDAVRSAQITSQAVDEKLLADGANLSAGAIFAYYAANQAQFTGVCVSRIVVATDAEATSVVNQVDAGASFAQLAKTQSIDTQTAADGGSLGCAYTLAEVEQSLQVQSIAVGKPVAPIQDSESGQWEVYEVTNAQLEPLSAAESVVRRELLQTTANVNRVSKEIQAFARRSSVSVDPQYGKWAGLTIVPPVGPPSQFLLAAVSGYPGSGSSSLKVDNGSDSGSAGSSTSAGGS